LKAAESGKDDDVEDIPEGDALEQAQEVLPGQDDDLTLPTSDPEVPEADAVEQAQTVPFDEEEERA
jgi:hypothetical protein